MFWRSLRGGFQCSVLLKYPGMDLCRVYEVNILFDPANTENECIQKLNNLSDRVRKYGPSVVLDKKLNYELAYPVKKKKTAHWFTFIFVTVVGESVEEIKKQLLLDESVLRFLILKLSKAEVGKLQEALTISKTSASQKGGASNLESMKNEALEIYKALEMS